jgi:hypothetical protein
LFSIVYVYFGLIRQALSTIRLGREIGSFSSPELAFANFAEGLQKSLENPAFAALFDRVYFAPQLFVCSKRLGQAHKDRHDRAHSPAAGLDIPCSINAFGAKCRCPIVSSRLSRNIFTENVQRRALRAYPRASCIC